MPIDACPKHSNQPIRPSLLDILAQVKAQVEFHCFADLRTNWVDPLYGELCLIISEVLAMNPDTTLMVNGVCVNTYLVQEVFSQLRNGHVRLVFDNFHNVLNRVYNKKAYLRTALYNSFFEIESHFANHQD